MANGVSIEIEGLDKLRKKLGKIPAALEREIDAELGVIAKNFENHAATSARNQGVFDNGRLVGDISSGRLAPMQWEVVSPHDYSAYQEFGTITKVRVPSELQSYALQFKGRGLRKTGGIVPRPFFFPQLPIARAELKKNLKPVIARAFK
jgi:hypothetical protein